MIYTFSKYETEEETKLTASITNKRAKFIISEVSIATALVYYSILKVFLKSSLIADIKVVTVKKS